MAGIAEVRTGPLKICVFAVWGATGFRDKIKIKGTRAWAPPVPHGRETAQLRARGFAHLDELRGYRGDEEEEGKGAPRRRRRKVVGGARGPYRCIALARPPLLRSSASLLASSSSLYRPDVHALSLPPRTFRPLFLHLIRLATRTHVLPPPLPSPRAVRPASSDCRPACSR